MAKQPARKNIEIERNVIEKYMMITRDFVKRNSRMVKVVSISLLVVIAILTAADLFYSHDSAKDRARLDSVLDSYRGDPANPENIEKCKNELRDSVSPW